MATEPCEIHLQDIERPELVNHRVRVPLVVAGIGKTYSIPSRVTVRCSGRADCLNGPRTLTLKAPEFWLRCLGQRNDAVERMVHSAVECSVRCHHIEIVRTAEHQTVTQIVVNPHYQELLLNSDTGKVTDELGRSWKSVNAVVPRHLERIKVTAVHRRGHRGAPPPKSRNYACNRPSRPSRPR